MKGTGRSSLRRLIDRAIGVRSAEGEPLADPNANWEISDHAPPCSKPTSVHDPWDDSFGVSGVGESVSDAVGGAAASDADRATSRQSFSGVADAISEDLVRETRLVVDAGCQVAPNTVSTEAPVESFSAAALEQKLADGLLNTLVQDSIAPDPPDRLQHDLSTALENELAAHYGDTFSSEDLDSEAGARSLSTSPQHDVTPASPIVIAVPTSEVSASLGADSDRPSGGLESTDLTNHTAEEIEDRCEEDDEQITEYSPADIDEPWLGSVSGSDWAGPADSKDTEGLSERDGSLTSLTAYGLAGQSADAGESRSDGDLNDLPANSHDTLGADWLKGDPQSVIDSVVVDSDVTDDDVIYGDFIDDDFIDGEFIDSDFDHEPDPLAAVEQFGIWDLDEDAQENPWLVDGEEETFSLRRAREKAAIFAEMLLYHNTKEFYASLPYLTELFLRLPHSATFMALQDAAVDGDLDLDTLRAVIDLREQWHERPEFWVYRHWGRICSMRNGQSALSWKLARQICRRRAEFPVDQMIDDGWLDEWLDLAPGSPGYVSFPAFIEESIKSDDARALHYGLERLHEVS